MSPTEVVAALQQAEVDPGFTSLGKHFLIPNLITIQYGKN